MSKRTKVLIFLGVALICLAAYRWFTNPERLWFPVAYVSRGAIVIHAQGYQPKVRGRTGHSPAFSPDGNSVAYLSSGNVFVARRNRSQYISKDTRHSPGDEPWYRSSISWDPSSRWVAYCKVWSVPYNEKERAYDLTMEPQPRAARCFVEAVWIKDVTTGRTACVVDSRSALRGTKRLAHPEKLATYQPLFGPDGRRLVFLRDGNVYEVRLDESRLKPIGQPYPLAAVPDGVQQMCWDAMNSRIYFSTGDIRRNYPSTGYASIPWNGQDWGTVHKLYPRISQRIRKHGATGCAIDPAGRLWVQADILDHDGLFSFLNESAIDPRWVRADLRRRLPEYADQPSFGQ